MTREEKDLLKKEYGKVWSPGSVLDYCVNNVSNIVTLDDGNLYVIEKPSIHTKFCFGYSLSSYDSEDYDKANADAENARHNVEYFVNENMERAGFDKLIKNMNDSGYKCVVGRMYGTNQPKDCKIMYMRCMHMCDPSPADTRPLTDREKIRIIATLKDAKARFNKRLNTYLKKYGLTCIDTWSYWRDA